MLQSYIVVLALPLCSAIGLDWPDTCANGLQQSPVSIQSKNAICDTSNYFAVEFVDEELFVPMRKKEFTIQTRIPYSKLYAIDIDGNMYGYTGTRFNFHSPSEHTVDGKYFDMELQLYHRINKEFTSKASRDVAIISVFFTVNDQIDQQFFNIYDFSLLDLNEPTNATLYINPQKLIGSQLDLTSYFMYSGSHTIPPCKEEVNWYILEKVLPINSKQLKNFNHFFKYNATFAHGNGNNRDLQKLNERKIRRKGNACESHFTQDCFVFILYVLVIIIIYKFI